MFANAIDSMATHYEIPINHKAMKVSLLNTIQWILLLSLSIHWMAIKQPPIQGRRQLRHTV